MATDSRSPMTVLAEHVAGELAAFGGTVAFGLPGGGNNLEVIGAAQRRGMQFVLGHTEYAVTVMAAVYGQVTNCPTASIVTRGPGAAAATNGVAQAWLDRQPLVLITDTVSAGDRARVPHQQLDQESVFRPIVKATIAAGTGSLGTGQVASAIAQAMALPRGPVHIDVDVQAAAPGTDVPAAAPQPADGAAVEAIGALIRGSSRPCILLGMGALDAVAAIRDYVAGTDIPVLSTYRAMGVIPDSWPNHAGPFTGATSEADVLGNADLIIAIGVDQVELIPNPWDYAAPVVSIASWPEKFSYFVATHEAVGAIDELLGRMPPAAGTGWPTAYGARRVTAARDALLEPPTRTPQRIAADAHRLAPAGAIATVDAGAHMLAALAMWRVEEPNGLLISTGLATMGFAVPAAIAAALAAPGRRVVCFVGDGGLSMVEAELETIARLGLPITVVVFNDSTLSLIAMKQAPEGQGGEAAVLYRQTDFAGIARAHGLEGVTVDTGDDLESALTASFASDRPALLDIAVSTADYRLVMSVTRGAPLIRPE